MTCENDDEDVPGYVRPMHRHGAKEHAHPRGGDPHHHHDAAECRAATQRRKTPMFGPRHYTAIAEKFAARLAVMPDDRSTVGCLRELAEMFEADNPKFDRARFMRAATNDQEDR